MGWSLNIAIPIPPKCVIAVAPHTSNWDFILGELAIRSVNQTAGFLMKETWFFFPLGAFFRALGGIPVPRKRGSDLTAAIVRKFHENERIALAVTPEGTRSPVENWRKGFLFIARDANVPLLLAAFDYEKKTITLDTEYHLSGDIDNDLANIKKYFSTVKGKYPEKFRF
ncbi:MAG: 1-acyl-sn-glycerol-3-phosphate acyltransferase [Muribaculaceae bacterium]|nr:1-acyl-sn-glycerol-3-phosphate acyltransferase [Muribaculaceae bacterium]